MINKTGKQRHWDLTSLIKRSGYRTGISLEIDCISMEEERDDLDNSMLELVDLILENRQGVYFD